MGFARLQRWLGRFDRGWARWRGAYRVLELLRCSVLIPAVLALTLLLSEQMSDALRALAEDARLGQGIALFLCAVFAGSVVWYSARTMLRFRFAGVPESAAQAWPRLKRHLPRVLGVAVPLLLALRIARLAPGSALPGALWILAAAMALGALVLAIYFVARRRIAVRTGFAVLARSEATERRDLTTQRDLPDTTRRVLYALLLANLLFAVLFTCCPMGWLGAPAILLLGLGLMTVVGSVLVYFANHYRVPMLLFLASWAALCSPFNDNHAVRAVQAMRSHGWFRRARAPDPASLPASPLARLTLADYFKEWWQDLATHEPGSGPVPVVVVVAEGGGIRAAYWTAQTLAKLEDATAADPLPFSRHVFAISAVSGGSLGAATFDALLARRLRLTTQDAASRQDEVDRMLGADFLSPTMGALLFPDLLQRFAPVPLANDRALALEQAWERAWAQSHPDDAAGFSQPFQALWARQPHAVPLLILGSTVVETGQRALVYPFASATVDSEASFADALAVGRYYGTSMPLSTATLLSARFPVISPAGLLDTRRAGALRYVRLVDGGYFDNTGAVTAQELVLQLQRLHEQFAGARAMRLIVLHLPNDPPAERRRSGALAQRLQGHVWLSETGSPLRAFMNAADGRGRQAVDFLQELTLSGAVTGRQFDLVLYQDGPELPLGWELS
ncbi:MAG TPA: hypothetical protein VMI92_02800, partial [Steroidobacteraceae bacterium]|nr:hypothetical protein [Steroidobacteraceae bacterium]